VRKILSFYKDVCEVVSDTLVKASTSFQPDQLTIYERAAEGEDDPRARWVLEKIIENAKVGEKAQLPLCDDTGIPQIFLEVGDEATIPPNFFSAVEKGVELGLKKLPGRPMAVKGNDSERIAQTAGLYDDPDMLVGAPFQIKRVIGKQIKMTVLMLGGGPEIRGKTMHVFHKHSAEVVLNEMISWAVKGASQLGCLPCVPAFGIGRTNLEAAVLAIEAMKEGNFLIQNEMEKRITEAINKSRIGPLGIGGKTTALATFIKVGPQRASGVRIVSLRLGCCFDPRRSTYTWPCF
jgi:fumarate hydratase subunit alpha